MPLRLEITSYHARRLAEDRAKEFGVEGGRIGRSAESDWILQDGNRYISSHHASIDFRSGSYYIIDTSRNGVYVNDGTRPIGRGKPQRLFDGDRIRIGEYEMIAKLTDDESVDETLRQVRHIDPVDRAQLVESPDPTGHDLVDEHEMTSVGIEDLLLEGASAAALRNAALKAAAGMTLESDTVLHPSLDMSSMEQMQARTEEPAAEEPAAHEPGDGSPSAAVYAFFRGAGMKPQDVGDEQAAAMLHGLGRLTRELARGLARAQRKRSDVESKLRISATTGPSGRQNPLNSDADIDDVLRSLVSSLGPAELSAADAAREAFVALEIHQLALLSAMHMAVMDLLERFDPSELAKTFERQLKRNSFIGSSGKRRYWDMYREAYDSIAMRAPGKLPEAFISEMAQSYEEETARILSERHVNDTVQVRELVLPDTKSG